MTVESTLVGKGFAFNGATVAFPIGADFQFIGGMDVALIMVAAGGAETVAAIGSAGISISGDPMGGAATLNVPLPAQAGYVSCRLERRTRRRQDANFTPDSAWPAAGAELAHDRAMLVDQEQDAMLDRAVKLPFGEIAPVLPKAQQRTGHKVLGFNPVTGVPQVVQLPIEPIEEPPFPIEMGISFTQLSDISLPPDATLLRTYSFDVPAIPFAGVGGADYILDPAVDAAMVAAHPRACRFDADGRGWRLAEQKPHAFMFGAIDAVGQIKATETLTDCSDALDALCAWWIAGKGTLIMDFSGVTGLGITRQWVWNTGLGTAAWWNAPIYRFIPGRLVAMASLIDTSVNPDEHPEMGHMVRTHGREFRNIGGAWEMWPGTDTIVNTGHMNAYARGGIYPIGAGGSDFGSITGQGFPRYLVQTAKINTELNNSIPLDFQARAVQCGSISAKQFDAVPDQGFGLWGEYYDGVWEGGNGSHLQTHRMKVPMSGHQAWLLEVGDMARCNGDKFSVCMIAEVIERTSTYIDLRMSYWMGPDEFEETGTIVFMQGGAISSWGDKLANGVLERSFAYNCGTGFQVNTLFAPHVENLLSEICQIGIQVGGVVQSAIHGLRVGGRHLETCLYSLVDADSAARDCWIGTDSTTSKDEEGILGRMIRLNAGYKDEDGNWTGRNTKGFEGFKFSVNGGVLDAGAGGVISIGGDSEPFLSNAPPRQRHGGKNMSLYGGDAAGQALKIILSFDRSVGRLINHARECEIGMIYSNEGTNGAPLGTITIEIDPDHDNETVSGGATLTIPPQTAGGIALRFFGECDDIFDPESPVDWKVFMRTEVMK